ncbi:hypothetical protein GE061_005135 [Apolygus lucorum]|uniref:Uncharacterized protein n=1 Tax=Apolygus lucorum TaxID=248454 RepID=A0A6A4IWD7_APOLU|nr:hypothetical protein GE061_005135 [Apolygus lucorum]
MKNFLELPVICSQVNAGKPFGQMLNELINPDINIERARLAQKSKELKNQFPGRKILRRQSSCPISGKISPGKLFCPACKKLEVPVIRRKKKFAGNEGIPVCYMLGCWPLCFLPYFMQSNRMFDVYCRNCSFFIGRYDKKLNIMMSRPAAKPLLSGHQTPARSTSQGTTASSRR